MLNPKSRRKQADRRQGAMLVLVAITLIIFIVSALVFSIDIAYMQLVRSQLRAAADAAAKAAQIHAHDVAK